MQIWFLVYEVHADFLTAESAKVSGTLARISIFGKLKTES